MCLDGLDGVARLERCADEHRGACAAVEHVLQEEGQLGVGKWHVGQLGLARPLRNVAGEQRLDAPLEREEADVDVKRLLQPLALLVVLGPRDARDLLSGLGSGSGSGSQVEMREIQGLGLDLGEISSPPCVMTRDRISLPASERDSFSLPPRSARKRRLRTSTPPRLCTRERMKRACVELG